MKNLHIIATDKPSRLYSKDGNHKLDNSTIAIDWYISSAGYKPHNIYITSDEEIKEGWKGYAYKEDVTGKVFKHFYTTNEWYKDAKKIILTTDQDLIADGVQAIDDEFLEWFVKNPSCENVEVGYGWIRLTETDNEGYWVSIPNKQFEMQQEEPKQELLPDFKITKNIFDFVTDLSDTKKEEPKQETLEEAALKWFVTANKHDIVFDLGWIKIFEAGAKWGSERIPIHILDVDNVYSHIENGVVIIEKNDKGKRSYSEGEVLQLLLRLQQTESYDNLYDWFEQFKKK